MVIFRHDHELYKNANSVANTDSVANKNDNLIFNSIDINSNNKKKYLFISTSNYVIQLLLSDLPNAFFKISDSLNKYIIDDKEIYVLINHNNSVEFTHSIFSILTPNKILFDKIFVLGDPQRINISSFIECLNQIQNRLKNKLDLLIFYHETVYDKSNHIFFDESVYRNDIYEHNRKISKKLMFNSLKKMFVRQKKHLTNSINSTNLINKIDKDSDNSIFSIDMTQKTLDDSNFDINFYFNYENILSTKKNNKFIFNEIERNKLNNEVQENIPNAVVVVNEAPPDTINPSAPQLL